MSKLFFNGTILTMESACPQQAVLVAGGAVRAVGSMKDLAPLAGDAEPVDLRGKTLMPAFIDAHSHLLAYATASLQASLENAGSFDAMLERLRAFAAENGLRDGDWLQACGYDHNKLREKRHPDKAMLDAAFPGLKVVLQHQSGHFGVFNSAGLERVGMTGRDRNGYLEENEFVAAVKKLPLPEPAQMMKACANAMRRYASYGIATAQEGLLTSQMLPLYQMLLAADALTLDVVGYPQISDMELFCRQLSGHVEQYHKHFRLGGCKLILDGSPQGRTAWMKTPYAGAADQFGVSCMTDDAVLAALQKAVENRWQPLAHCNGDAAAEQYLRCAEKIQDRAALAALRPVMIHAQLVEKAQLLRLRALGMIPSFFVAHCYHWGDVHIDNFGKARAEQISPARTALELGIPFTFHQDAPVIEPNMMETVWCAVNRRTKEGVTIGGDERVPVWEALKAVTVNAAFQYGEERSKGTLAPGKRADMVVLERNPLAVPPQDIRGIRVLRTYRSGKCIYSD